MSDNERFPRPLAEQDLSMRLEFGIKICEHGLTSLMSFEQDRNHERAVDCENAFLNCIDFLENGILHPSDSERILSDQHFFRNFKSVVERMKSAKIVEFEEGYLRSQPSDITGEVIRKRVSLVSDALVRADLYLASSTLAKEQKQDEQR